MNVLRCFGLSLLVFLSACDAEKSPVPPAKVAAASPASEEKPSAALLAPAGVPVVAPVDAPIKSLAAPVHELPANIPVVPVVAAGKPLPVSKSVAVVKAAASEHKAPAANAKSAKIKADNAEVANRATVASKTKAPSQVVKDTHLARPNLDLSLPPELVRQLTPPSQVITATTRGKPPASGAKPLLPKMFQPEDGDPDFQLQGRLLSNEMQLQLRNESRREVEGAAVDFTFKQ